MKKLFTLLTFVALFAINAVYAQVKEAEKPLLTIGCLSDLHSQGSLISGDVNNIRLRGTVLTTLNAMKEQENLDLIVLGGDYLSDVTIPRENWVRMQQMLISATRSAFQEGSKTPVIYVNGNHDYEVANFDYLPKEYNAGEYYSQPMKTDIGALPEEDCFYEIASNGSSPATRILAAYHYVVKGFDFVVLNTGKNMFASAWDYTYSEESVQWVSDKLAEIYAEDKDKTVFFLVHIPFADSKSLSATNKGMFGTSAVHLKYVLAQYPNLIMLYGHDHGKNTAYIRENTAQRVTVYDNFGNVWNDGETTEPEANSYYIRNAATGDYLSYDAATNMTVSETEAMGTVKASDLFTGTFSIEFTSSAGIRYLHCGSSGRFSGNAALSQNSSLYFYKVDDPTAQSGTAKRVTEVEAGASYLLVTLSTAGGYHMLTNELYGSGTGLRMIGVKVSDDVPGEEITFTQTSEVSPVWSFTDGNEEEAPEVKGYSVKNVATNQYLTYDPASNMTMSDTPTFGTIDVSTFVEGTLFINFSDGAGSVRYLHCGSSGRFSGNAALSKNSSLYVYKVDDATAESGTAKRVTEIENGGSYLFVTLSSKGGYFMLTNELYSSGADLRMIGVKVSDDVPADEIPFTQTATVSPVWTISDGSVEEPVVKSYSVKNVANNQFLTYDPASNMTTSETPAYGTIDVSTMVEGTLFINFSDGAGSVRYLHCGSSGRFSGNAALSQNSSLYVYKVDDITAESGTAKRVTSIENGGSYLLVTLSTAGGYHMLTNELYGGGSGLRMVGVKVSDNVPADEIPFTQTATVSPVWTISEQGEEEVVETSVYYLQNYNTSKYLGFNTFNLSNTDFPTSEVTVSESSKKAGAFAIHITNAPDNNPYLNCGTNGRFSGNSDPNSISTVIMAFEVEDPNAETITATQVDKITAGKTYLLVGLKSGKYYALTNEMYRPESANQRMVGEEVTIENDTISLTPGESSALWTFVEKGTEVGTKSFFSSFMGSMRYYSNSIEDSDNENDSRIIQALMVYVYPDRVELKMKNYGESGTINGITVNKDLVPYIVEREVRHSEEAVTSTPSFVGETGGKINLGDTIKVQLDVPEWHNVYYTVDGSEPTEESLKAENGIIEWTPTEEGEYTLNVAAQEGIRLMSQSISTMKYTVEGTTGIEDMFSGNNSRVFATNNSITVKNYTGDVKIYNTVGQLVKQSNITLNGSFSMEKGVYVVMLNNVAYKVAVQ